jgi:DNA-binding HxlR family transcriptional regulator
MEKCENNVEPLQFVLRVLGGKWKLHILSNLYSGKKRFKELERAVTGVSPKMLIKELKDLEAVGIINRQTFNTVPITVEYSLTKEGLTLKPVLDQMKQWSEDFKKQAQLKETRSVNGMTKKRALLSR